LPEDLELFFASHGISMEVANARPYMRFEQGDFETVLENHAEYTRRRLPYGPWTEEAADAVRKERRHLRNIVKQSSGLIMNRHTLGGTSLRGPTEAEDRVQPGGER
jgi:hypothetical protein